MDELMRGETMVGTEMTENKEDDRVSSEHDNLGPGM